MSQYVEAPCRQFTAGAAIAKYLRVKTPSSLAAAGAVDVELGTMENASLAANDVVSVRLRTAYGTQKMVASEAISAGANVYGAAGGKVSDTANGNFIGTALDAAGADGDVIEVLRGVPRADGSTVTVEAHTADDTLVVAESGSLHTNTGAAGTITISLPAATAGLEFLFAVGAAQQLRIDPNGSETISLPSNGVPGAAGKYLVADAIGETVSLVCASAGSWRVMGFTGTWTAEA